MKRIILISIVALLLAACKKNEHYTGFEGSDKVFFAANESSDSLVYSFANAPAADDHTLRLSLKVMGAVSDKDRRVQVAVVVAESSALPAEYELGEAIIPAGSPTGYVPLKIVNTPRLETEQVQLTLRLMDSDAFTVEREKPGKFSELVKFKVRWTNELVEPDEWPFGWGGYSQVKHRLVIDLTGHFIYERFGFDYEFQVMGVCNQWLEAYNATHSEPYKDENGNIVRFCRTCP